MISQIRFILGVLWRLMEGLMFVLVLVLAITGGIFYLALSLKDHPDELGLIAVPAITMFVVIIAAAIYKGMVQTDKEPSQGEVFRESVKRYAWLAAPIASGFGISQIIDKIAESVARTPSPGS